MVIGVTTVGIETVDLNCLIVSSSRSTSSGQSWSVVALSAVATARNSIRKTWAKKRERRGEKEREESKKEGERRIKKKKTAGGRREKEDRGRGKKKSKWKRERGLRLKMRRREKERSEAGHQQRLKSSNLPPAVASCPTRWYPRPRDWFANYS